MLYCHYFIQFISAILCLTEYNYQHQHYSKGKVESADDANHNTFMNAVMQTTINRVGIHDKKQHMMDVLLFLQSA